MYEDRILSAKLREKLMSAEEAAGLIRDGMTIGASGFTRVGYPKAVP
jgi:acyl-CoA hydrolase